MDRRPHPSRRPGPVFRRVPAAGSRVVALLAALSLAGAALAADEVPASRKYGRTDTATIERIESDALVVADPHRSGAVVRYGMDPHTVVVGPAGREIGVGALEVGDRVAIDAQRRGGGPVAEVIHVVIEPPDPGAAE